VFKVQPKQIAKNQVQEITDYIQKLKDTSKESKFKKLNSNVIREFLISDSYTFTNNVMLENEKHIQIDLKKKNQDEFRKKAGWGDWCGPEEFKEFKKENSDEALATRARTRLKEMVSKSDLDGYVIKSEDAGKLNSRFKTNRVPFPYSIEQYNNLMLSNISREANSVCTFDKLVYAQVEKGQGQ